MTVDGDATAHIPPIVAPPPGFVSAEAKTTLQVIVKFFDRHLGT